MTARVKYGLLRIVFAFGLGWLGLVSSTHAQRASGLILINRLGLSYQKAVGTDLGLISHHTRYGYRKGNFYDFSLGVESLFAQRFVLVPKINVDMGFRSALFEGATVGGGFDTGWFTDFSGGNWRITPKTGITWGSVFRLYYGYHLYVSDDIPTATTRHRLSFELNIAAFHDIGIGN
ncbi:MAG: hypothetical protein EAS52_25375 [Parapedobacter sp.]|nr:MAG: hypothetical protein EAS52_25375 [Parapedobacter sp.]